MIATARALKPTRVLKKFGSMKVALEKANSKAKLRRFKVRHFEPNVTFEFERGHYIVKTAENGAELEECLKLRFEVFHREYLKKKRTFGVDIDKLDDICDHLMIRDRRSGKVIGTYRLNCSKFTDVFYSASEFHMDRIAEMPGTKLELGRACIDKDHRNGVIVALLWRGIAEYIQRTETKVMIGCGSIKTMDPLETGLITKYLMDEGAISKEWGVSPTRKFKMRQLGRVMEYIEANPFVFDAEEVKKLIPALLNSYLKMGAKLAGEPALDRDFHCIDYLIVLQTDEMAAVFKDKYKV